MKNYLKETELLDYSSSVIQNLILKKGWYDLSEKKRIKEIYNFVRDDIKFGYNINDSISSSKVLKDGYGLKEYCLCHCLEQLVFLAVFMVLLLTKNFKKV